MQGRPEARAIVRSRLNLSLAVYEVFRIYHVIFQPHCESENLWLMPMTRKLIIIESRTRKIEP